MIEKRPRGNGQDFWNFVSIILFVVLFSAMYHLVARGSLSLFYSAKPIDIFLISFATLRMIRLLSYDKVTSFLRDFFGKNEGGMGRTVYELLICPWCTGIWVALLLVPFYFLTEVGKIFVLVAAIAGIGSMVQVVLNAIAKRHMPEG
jgi:hypothetical protein